MWGSGNAGLFRDGSHAGQIVVPVASLRHKPATLSFEEAATVGVNFVTAWRALVDVAALRDGETLVIIGSAGGVGGAAAQIARRRGARVIGVDRSAPPEGAAIVGIADPLIVGAQDVPAAVLAATAGRGADVVFNAVGGVMFRVALACLAPYGRQLEISATGKREVSFDIADFYHNESRLLGVDSLKLDLAAAAAALDALAPGFAAGDYRPAPIARVFALDDAVAAYRAVAEGARGRIVLRP